MILGGSGLPRSGIESGATLRCPGKVDGSLPLSALLWRSHLPQAQRDKIFESTREDRIRLPRPSPMVRYLGSLHDPSPTALGRYVRSTYTSEQLVFTFSPNSVPGDQPLAVTIPVQVR